MDGGATDRLQATLPSLDWQVYPAWHLTILAEDEAAAEAVRGEWRTWPLTGSSR